MVHGTFRKRIFNILHKPNFCHNINYVKYPWGWKSNHDVKKIVEFPIKSLDKNIDHLNNNYDLRYIHEYKIREYAEELYSKTYYAFLNNYDFLNTTVVCPKLAVGLNYLRSKTDISNFNDDFKINNIKVLDSWIKYGSIRNISKFLGFYNDKEILHELSAGILGPEVQTVWDQRSLKQKVRVIIESDIFDERLDVLDLERDLMVTNGEWQLSNINRVISNQT